MYMYMFVLFIFVVLKIFAFKLASPTRESRRYTNAG